MSDTATMPQMVSGQSVWYEIPTSDLSKAQTFYETVLNIKMHPNDNGPNPMVDFADPSLPIAAGHLYPGKPAEIGSGPTVHMLAMEPLETVMKRVEPAGGKIVSPIIDIPPGRFVYITDIDGNSVGLFNRKGH